MKNKMKLKLGAPQAAKKDKKFKKNFKNKNKNQKKIGTNSAGEVIKTHFVAKPTKKIDEESESSNDEIADNLQQDENEKVISQMDTNASADESDPEPTLKMKKKSKKPKSTEKTVKHSNEKTSDTKDDEVKFKYDKADENLTVFCGNIPNGSDVNKAKIKELFSKYGQIKSMRIRSEGGKVIYNKKMMNKTEIFNAYIVFTNEEDAKKSIELNGHEILGHHLRVNMANRKHDAFSNKGTIFVGNLPFEATEAEIHDFFSPVGKIEYVRKIPKRGIGYVRFDKGVDIVKALKMNDQVLGGRNIRVSRCETKEKQEKKKIFKKDEKTGKFNKQRVKKSHKIKDNVLLSGRSNNNPIIKKIKEKQTAKFNKFSSENQVSKSEIFRRGGQMDQNLKNLNREKTKKKQVFSGTKVDDINMKSKKIKKNKVSKMVKQQKVIVKKLKSAAARTKN